MRKVRLGIFLSLCLALALAYVVKVKLHINLSKSFSLTNHFPLLARIEPTAIERTMVGPLVTETFERTLAGGLDWANLWSREPNRVKKSVVKDASQGSRCLRIDSETELIWSYVGFYHYRVSPGEVFRLKVDTRFDGPQQLALVIDAYGPDLAVLQRGYCRLPLDQPGEWHTYETEFSIDTLPTYIKIRLEGRGQGRSRFDNIRLDRLK